MKITINLPEKVFFNSRGNDFELAFADIEVSKRADLIADAVMAGFSKAGVDAASAAKSYAEENKIDIDEATKILVDKRLATWKRGDWGAVRGGGSGLSALDREVISLVRPSVKAADEQKYKNAAEPERVEMCKAYIATLTQVQLDAYMKHAEGRLAAKEAEAKAAKELAELVAGMVNTAPTE